MALVEISVGVITAAVASYFCKLDALISNLQWLHFLVASGAALLTFLASAKLEPEVIPKKLNEVSVGGLVGFFAPFPGYTVYRLPCHCRHRL